MSKHIDLKQSETLAHIEEVLQEVIFPDLEKGRKDFDLPHTKAVVFWAQELLTHVKNRTVDPLVLVTAAYAHDWGYIGLFDGLKHRSIEEIHKMKPLHMQRGATMIAVLMKQRLNKYLTKAQQQRIAHLVQVHDLVEELVAEDEILLMEADTLGMLDLERVTPTFSKADNNIFVEREVYGRRFPRFQHAYAKKMGKTLLAKRVSFYQ